MKEKFTFIRHWNALRFSPKYQASLAKKNKPAKDKDASSQSVDSQIPTSLESDEMMERPIGRKAAKKLKKAANEVKDEDLELLKTMQKDALAIASLRSESVQISLQLQKEMKQLQKDELQLRLAKEERERQKEEQERQTQLPNLCVLLRLLRCCRLRGAWGVREMGKNRRLYQRPTGDG